MTRLDLRLFGGFQAKLDGNELQFPTRKSEGLLAYLAMPPGNTHSREKLAALLWSESGDEQARQSLRQTIFTLRKVLNSEDVVVSGDSDRIALNEERVSVDAIRFQEILSTGDSARVAEAVELYRGDFLEGLTINEENFENWVQIERERLREMVLSAAADLLDRQVAEGKLDSAVQTALRILGIDPLRESTHRSLMKIYLQQGRREAAIKQYHACSESLRRHLQVEPEEETTALYQEIMKASSAQARGRDERIRILMVEDNLLNRQLVTSMLDEKKYELVIAEDGGKALLELGSKRFDLILLDIKLPNVDGLTLLKIIRENQHQTPTILMTAMPGPEAEIKGLKLGATDFIRKPLQKSVLLARIQKALGRTD